MDDSLDRRLAAGMAALGVPGPPEQRAKLLAFLRLIEKWNRVYNLTAIRGLEEAVDLHLLDSLAVMPDLRGERILDLGTGAGLPGIPLAVICPEQHFVLLDSNAKKTRFVQQAVIELGLKNVDVVTGRVEQYHPGQGFDAILARAYGSLSGIVGATIRMLTPGGRILALKGQLPLGELAELEGYAVRVRKLCIPGLAMERHVIEIGVG